MKKLFLLPILLLMLLLTSCQLAGDSTYTGDLKLNIQHIKESDSDKNIDISYPVFGGIENKEAITIINTSISNYVTAEYDEFQNALTAKNQSVITDAAANGAGDSSDSNDSDNSDDSDDSDDSDASDDSEDSDDSGDDAAVTGSDTAKTDSTGEPIRLTMSFKITYNKNDYLCVVQTYKKELGENKTFTGQRSFLFSLKNAAYLSLGEVFDFDSGFSAYINKAIEAELDKGAYNTYDSDNGFTGISKDCNFYIDHDYLYIYYNALEISPDMDIVPTFVFKIKDLKEYFNDDFTNIF